MVPMVPRTFAEVGMEVWGGIFGGYSFFLFCLFIWAGEGVWEWEIGGCVQVGGFYAYCFDCVFGW